MRHLLALTLLTLAACPPRPLAADPAPHRTDRPPAPARESVGEVETEDDRYTGDRFVDLGGMTLWSSQSDGELTLIASRDVPGFLLRVHAVRREWRWLECARVDVLVDGKPMPSMSSQHVGRVNRSGVVDAVQADYSAEDLVRLEVAVALDIRVCRDEFVIRGERMKTIREFARRAASDL